MRIVIADDHELLREGVKKILRGEPQARVVGEAASAEELPALLRACEPDVLILDINLPGRSGVEAIGELRALRPGLAVIVLSMHPEDRFALRALRAGALGYVSKASAAQELLEAVRAASRGRRYISPAVAELLAAELDGAAARAPHERLSAREAEILSKIGAGKSTKQIAAELSISVNTVNTHRARTLEKMGMRTNAELIRYAVKHGL